MAQTVKRHLAFTLVATCVTAWFSYAYFHLDEYFQVIELARLKLVPQDIKAMPWEHAQAMRSWLQPGFYVVIGGLLGLRDIFSLAFVFRLVTGLLNVAALALFLRTTLPWQTTPEQRSAHLRVLTLAGFLPYLFVRTSSESASMAALTAGFALLFEGAKDDDAGWNLPSLGRPARLLATGLSFGIAFEVRFQTAFVTLGVTAWLWRFAGARLKVLGLVAIGFAIALAIGALVNRWGYGRWTFPAWTYFQANILEGASGLFGNELPFAYLWLSPANVFLPVIVVFIALLVRAWIRAPRHPLTWTTLPFVVIHNLISHKEERFLFPIAILALGLISVTGGRPDRSRFLIAANTLPMVLLAFYPLGWHHNVRFTRAMHDRVGDELHAKALPEVELGLPAFHPRVYDVQKVADANTLAAGDWVITDQVNPELPNATLVYSELPQSKALVDLVNAYNEHARAPLRPLRFRSLYRINDAR